MLEAGRTFDSVQQTCIKDPTIPTRKPEFSQADRHVRYQIQKDEDLCSSQHSQYMGSEADELWFSHSTFYLHRSSIKSMVTRALNDTSDGLQDYWNATLNLDCGFRNNLAQA
ncbi:hypothetical protein P7K49_026477 [Saguinus oedipus]|uniref:Uncharacterized protein n=1 Tax=Saguinus oedipus TaxID=9490 RepID=A0ABQ9UDQ5_SAGOE|nr:hypothetical protein P7K49_026477 [Saguinus oedipus]